MCLSTGFGLYIYPWDLKESTSYSLLGKLKEAGIQRLHLAASYHAGKFLRPHGQQRRVYFPEDGTVYFQPQETYELLGPKPASMVPQTSELAAWWQHDFAETAAWTVVNHNSRLGWKHPACCVRNAFGDVYPYSLCPANHHVRHFNEKLCQDVAKLPVDAIQLESPGFLPFGHGYHHEFQLVRHHVAREHLLGLCFCESCHDLASSSMGLDLERLQFQVRAWIQERWGESHGNLPSQIADWQNLLDNSPALQTFLQWRCRLVTESLERIRNLIPKTTRLEVIPTIQSQLGLVYLEGSDLLGMAKVVDRIELPLYHAQSEALFADLDGVLANISKEKLSVILRPGYPDVKDQQTLRNRVRGILDRGIANLNFYNFGHLPEARLFDLSDILQSVGVS